MMEKKVVREGKKKGLGNPPAEAGDGSRDPDGPERPPRDC